MLTHECQCCNCSEVYDIDECGGVLTVEGENDFEQYETLSEVHCPKCSSTEKIELEVY